jgi:hypothetical protein
MTRRKKSRGSRGAAARSANIRISSLVETVDFARETFGDQAATTLVESLPSDIQRKIELAMLDAWVPFDTFLGLLSTLAARHDGGDLSTVRDSGRYAAAQEFPRRFGALSLPAELSLVDRLNGFAPLWRVIIDQGHFKAAFDGDVLEMHICDFPHATELYGHRLGGWLQGYVERLTGEPSRVVLHDCNPTAPASLVYRVLAAK